MTDKELIKQEIEYRLSSGKYSINSKQALEDIIVFIDSLPEEPASEDLEEEMIRWHKEHFGNKRDWEKTSGEYLTRKSQLDIAQHFAEWQREKDIKLEKIDDLEEFAQKWAYSNYHKELDEVNCDCLYSGVKKGAEWQKQQMKEALQTEYEKGRFDMQQEMMKDAVEGTVKYEIGSAEIPQCDRRYQVLSDPAPIANAKLGNKVKIIILKTE